MHQSPPLVSINKKKPIRVASLYMSASTPRVVDTTAIHQVFCTRGPHFTRLLYQEDYYFSYCNRAQQVTRLKGYCTLYT